MFVEYIFADDIALLAPMSTSLNEVLDPCKQYADNIYSTFIVHKTKCMYFDYSDSTNCSNNIAFIKKILLNLSLMWNY